MLSFLIFLLISCFWSTCQCQNLLCNTLQHPSYFLASLPAHIIYCKQFKTFIVVYVLFLLYFMFLVHLPVLESVMWHTPETGIFSRINTISMLSIANNLKSIYCWRCIVSSVFCYTFSCSWRTCRCRNLLYDILRQPAYFPTSILAQILLKYARNGPQRLV